MHVVTLRRGDWFALREPAQLCFLRSDSHGATIGIIGPHAEALALIPPPARALTAIARDLLHRETFPPPETLPEVSHGIPPETGLDAA